MYSNSAEWNRIKWKKVLLHASCYHHNNCRNYHVSFFFASVDLTKLTSSLKRLKKCVSSMNFNCISKYNNRLITKNRTHIETILHPGYFSEFVVTKLDITMSASLDYFKYFYCYYLNLVMHKTKKNGGSNAYFILLFKKKLILQNFVIATLSVKTF